MNSKMTDLHSKRSAGYRLTKVRQALVSLFGDTTLPLSITDIKAALASSNLFPHKTTLYREIEFLSGQGLVQKVDLGDGKMRYEAMHGHHHHLICTDCGTIADVQFENDIEELEQAILKQSRFRVERHNLEFFGLCQTCQ